MTWRRFWSWKTLFYEVALPVLRWLGPERADAVLAVSGRILGLRPGSRRSLAQARAALGADWDLPATGRALAANTPRFFARDVLLDGLSDADSLDRFDVSGFEHVEGALAEKRGLILLGSHFGAHLAALHWLDRRGVPFRMLVQRPKHLSRRLRDRFDADDPRLPQRVFDLRRRMPPAEAVRSLLVARDALRAGWIVYLNGDIELDSPNALPGRLLGRERQFLAIWTELAALQGCPVIPLFCSHRPGGRYRLTFDPPWTVRHGDRAEAVARYLARLEAEIEAQPAEAIAQFVLE